MATIQRARLAGCRHCPRRGASFFAVVTDVIGLGPSFRAQRQFSPRVGEQHRLDHRPFRNCRTTISLVVDDQEKVIVRRFASVNSGTFSPSGSAATRSRDYSVLASCQFGPRRNSVGIGREPCRRHSSPFLNCFLFSSSRSFGSSKHGQKPNSETHGNEQKQISHSTTSHPSSSLTSDPPVWTWVEQVLPLRWQPYARLARLDKPIGTMLLVRMNQRTRVAL